MGKLPENTPEALNAHFGRHEFSNTGEPSERWQRENLVEIETQFPLRLSVDPNHHVRAIRCHALAKHAISNALQRIFDHYDRDLAKIRKAKADLFGGCFMPFPIKDGSRLSLHAWGAAIALGPAGKPNPVILEAFQAEGWQNDGSNIYAGITIPEKEGDKK